MVKASSNFLSRQDLFLGHAFKFLQRPCHDDLVVGRIGHVEVDALHINLRKLHFDVCHELHQDLTRDTKFDIMLKN